MCLTSPFLPFPATCSPVLVPSTTVTLEHSLVSMGHIWLPNWVLETPVLKPASSDFFLRSYVSSGNTALFNKATNICKIFLTNYCNTVTFGKPFALKTIGMPNHICSFGPKRTDSIPCSKILLPHSVLSCLLNISLLPLNFSLGTYSTKAKVDLGWLHCPADQ